MNDETKPEQGTRRRVRQRLRDALASGLALGTAVATAHEGPPIVCDPLPPPVIRCKSATLEELGKRLHPGAHWTGTGESRKLYLTLDVWDSDVVLGRPTLSGGTLVPDDHNLLIRPDRGATTLTVTIPVPCRGPRAEFVLHLRLDAPDGTIPVTVSTSE